MFLVESRMHQHIRMVALNDADFAIYLLGSSNQSLKYHLLPSHIIIVIKTEIVTGKVL